MALPASQLASRIPDPYIHMWAASLLRGEKSHVKCCMLLPYFLPQLINNLLLSLTNCMYLL